MGAPFGNKNGLKTMVPAKKGQRGANNNGGRKKGTPNKLTVAELEREVRYLAMFDPRQLLKKIGKGKQARFTLKEIAELPDEIARCIASYDVVTQNVNGGDDHQDTVIKVRWYDKTKALELFARHFKWVDPNDRESGLDVLVQRLQQARSLTVTHVQASLPEPQPSVIDVIAPPHAAKPLMVFKAGVRHDPE
jgi:hypothetical protein